MSRWAKWRWQLGGALGVAIAGSACGLTESEAPPPATQVESCVGGELEGYCAPHGCPPSPDSVQTVCQHAGGIATTTRGPTDCGGTLVHINYGTHAESYFFDQHDSLIGVSLTGDTAQRCPSGRSESFVTTYGTACAASDPQTTLPCPSGAGGGPSALGGSGGSAGSGGMPGTTCTGGSSADPVPGNPLPWARRSDLTEATTCSAPPASNYERADECGCNELTCPDKATCLLVGLPAPITIGGPSSDFNGCFQLCESDADCSAPAVCVGNVQGLLVCKEVECRSNSDCTAAPCGFCNPGYFFGHGLILTDPSSSTCSY